MEVSCSCMPAGTACWSVIAGAESFSIGSSSGWSLEMSLIARPESTLDTSSSLPSSVPQISQNSVNT
ncbi:hypothetical protein V2G26_015393 [Clonostachys chloroleuca]